MIYDLSMYAFSKKKKLLKLYREIGQHLDQVTQVIMTNEKERAAVGLRMWYAEGDTSSST